ncbi:hypothetical protein Salat_0539000 [Sesamum alatum]|uniref:Uncharacterized protein n=1 Tax=Sesamum alatum TaxID=300844 RepID=A0AAE1YPY3_9LAMI|nr:hypothetical protein Salat_0539000 [Sesamum alatum]
MATEELAIRAEKESEVESQGSTGKPFVANVGEKGDAAAGGQSGMTELVSELLKLVKTTNIASDPITAFANYTPSTPALADSSPDTNPNQNPSPLPLARLSTPPTALPSLPQMPSPPHVPRSSRRVP